MYIYPCFYDYNWINIKKYEYMNEMAFVDMMRAYDKRSSPKSTFTTAEAEWIAKYLGIKFDRFDVEEFRIGLNVELEHGSIDPFTNVTDDDTILTGKIALAHLNEFPDYYKRLSKMEEEAEEYWDVK